MNSIDNDNIKKPPNKKVERYILGIDPGTNIMGYGIIRQNGNLLTHVCHGILKLDKYSNHALKLKTIFEKITLLIDQYKPDEIALEAPFYGKNVQSMLKLGRAQGVAMVAALIRKIPTQEYAPKKVKVSITGNGNASKEQISHMVATLLNLKLTPTKLDATDALAVAICHCSQNKITSKIKNTWSSFLKQNPNRLCK